jgi:hypothetical protein
LWNGFEAKWAGGLRSLGLRGLLLDGLQVGVVIHAPLAWLTTPTAAAASAAATATTTATAAAAAATAAAAVAAAIASSAASAASAASVAAAAAAAATPSAAAPVSRTVVGGLGAEGLLIGGAVDVLALRRSVVRVEVVVERLGLVVLLGDLHALQRAPRRLLLLGFARLVRGAVFGSLRGATSAARPTGDRPARTLTGVSLAKRALADAKS